MNKPIDWTTTPQFISSVEHGVTKTAVLHARGCIIRVEVSTRQTTRAEWVLHARRSQVDGERVIDAGLAYRQQGDHWPTDRYIEDQAAIVAIAVNGCLSIQNGIQRKREAAAALKRQRDELSKPRPTYPRGLVEPCSGDRP